jgi:hypothetical protein
MQVDQIEGKWVVTNGARIIGEFGSNAAAWRFIDKATAEALSPKEAFTDFLWRRRIGSLPKLVGTKASRKRKKRRR